MKKYLSMLLLMVLLIQVPTFAAPRDNSSWMENMWNDIDHLTINNVILPGTHDSGTSSITGSSDIAPDGGDFLRTLEDYGIRLDIEGLAKFSKTQKYKIYDQLKYGIRYFDLRVGPKSNGDLRFVHFKYGDSVSDAISDMGEFLKNNEKEIIILDFQHFHGMSSQDHSNLLNLLSRHLGSYMTTSYQSTLNQKTLEELYQNNQRAIILYSNGDYYNHVYNTSLKNNIFSRSSAISSPWMQDEWNYKTLLPKLESSLNNRPYNKLFVSQCISSLSTSRYFWSFITGKYLDDFAEDLNPKVADWVTKTAKQKGNIIMVDFFNTPNNFIDRIIDTNRK